MTKSREYRVARQFAQALDAEDFSTAGSLLAWDCIYESPSGTLQGPEAILDSYRQNNAKAQQCFAKIEYESQVLEADKTSATLLFVDHLTHESGQHTYCSRQHLRINAKGLISQITHQEIEAERRELEAFLTRCGIEL